MDSTTFWTEAEEESRLQRVPLTALYEALVQVKDGRKKRGCRYSIALILTLLLLARLAGETEIGGAAQWIKLRRKWIIQQLGLTCKSVPCRGTYLYALSLLEAQDLLTVVASCVTRWETEARCGQEPSRAARSREAKRCGAPWDMGPQIRGGCMSIRCMKCEVGLIFPQFERVVECGKNDLKKRRS